MAEISLYDHEWRLEVTEKLSTLIQRTTDLTDQVKRQNGNVARLWDHVNSIETSVATIQGSSRGERRATQEWAAWVRPAIMAVLAFLLGLVARNAGTIWTAIRG